jgi:hypothetical protein
MSDFAPFIAAFLRQNHQTGAEFTESYEQNKRLRALGRKMRAVSITGLGGSPVYAQGQLDEDVESTACSWQVSFKNWPARVPMGGLGVVEVCIGESIKLSLSRRLPNDHTIVHYVWFPRYSHDLHCARMFIFGMDGSRSAALKLCVTLSPITYDQYSSLPARPPNHPSVVSIEEVFSSIYSANQSIALVFHSVTFQTSLWTGWNADRFHSLRASTLLLSPQWQQCKQQRSHVSDLAMMDLSKLAKQIASELCEKTIMDLNEENQRLQTLVRQMRTVSITGPSGTPVYVTGQLDENGSKHETLDDAWTVEFPRQPVPLASLEVLCNMEVHIGEVIKVSLTRHHLGNYKSHFELLSHRELDQEARLVFEGQGGASGLTLWVYVSPITEEQYNSIVVEREEFTVDMMEEVFSGIFEDGLMVSFQKIDFDNDMLTGWNIGNFLVDA